MSDADASVSLLPPRLRQVMEMVRLGRKAKDIASCLGMTVQHVYVSISSAKKRIASGGVSLYRQRRDRDERERLRIQAAKDTGAACQWGHEKKPGRACLECTRVARGERIEPNATERVARELAAGKRCRHPMVSGRPCSLLLPCADHER